MQKEMKKWISRLLVFLLLAACIRTGRSEVQAAEETAIEKKTYPHIYCYEKGKECSDEINFYYVDGGTVPYVSLSEFIPVLTEMYNTVLECDDENEISFGIETNMDEIENEEDIVFIVSREDNGSMMLVQPGDDTIIFTNYNSFSQKPGSSALVRMANVPDPAETNNGIAILEQLMQAQKNGEDTEALSAKLWGGDMGEDPAAEHSLYVATDVIFNRRGMPLTMNLGEYGIDLISKDGECYIPFQTVNDIFFGIQYISYVFNGEKLVGDVYGGELMDQVYEVEPADMSEDYALFNYHELCFFLDYFYGLKEEHRIDSMDEFLIGASKLPQISGSDSVAFDSAMTEILSRYFDDSHSGIVRYSWRSGQEEGIELIGTMASMGYSQKNMFQIANKLAEARNAVYPDEVPGYEEIGDTAFVTFDTFTADRKPEEYYELEDPDNPQDTVELIMYANRQVRREGSPIKNIVMDLSKNGGGNSDAAIVAASWFTGAARISLLDTMTGAETIESLRTDLNVNGVTLSNPDGGYEQYDPGDTVSGQYNLFCIISPESFSCGNLVPAIFEQAGGITLIGQRSGGGSNAVLPSSTASGLLFQISGPLQITTFNNGSFYGVDMGVEPHVRLNFYDSFYDREGLVEIIHDLK